MKVFYSTSTGNPIAVVKDADLFWFKNTINQLYEILEIDELLPENQDLCIDLLKTQTKRNSAGETKYYILEGILYTRDGWEAVENE